MSDEDTDARSKIISMLTQPLPLSDAQTAEDKKDRIEHAGSTVSFGDIVDRTGLAKSTVANYLKEFQEQDVVEKVEHGEYRLKDLTDTAQELLEEVIENGGSGKLSEITEDVAKESVIQQLEAQNYLIVTSEDDVKLTAKSYALRDRCPICADDLGEGLTVSTELNDGYSVAVHPDCLATEDVEGNMQTWLKTYGFSAEERDFCAYCGLPLNPKALIFLHSLFPSNFQDKLFDDQQDELELDDSLNTLDRKLLDDLYGPVSNAYSKFQLHIEHGPFSWGNPDPMTEAFFATYRHNGRNYHYRCYNQTKE